MSLLYSKQSISKADIIESLNLLLKPKSQQDFDLACQYFGSLIRKHAAEVFKILRQKSNVKFVEPKTQNLLNILYVIHANIDEETIAIQLREPPIYWLERLLAENKESFVLIEKMLNDASTSSFLPQESAIIKQNINPNKMEFIQEKRSVRIELNEQLKNPMIKSQYQVNQCQMKPKIFCIIYYSYLQKLSINLFVFKSIKGLKYPYDEPEDTKLKFIWIYKIQNLMLMGLKLLECTNSIFKLYQDLIYQNMIQFLIFIRQEIELLIDHYATISNLDCLSLYEIYSEFQRAQAIVENYCSDIDLKLRVSARQIEEFLSFSVRIKVLNQFNFKKSLKVPTRHQPNISCNQNTEFEIKHQKAQSEFNKENMDQLNIQELQEQLSDEEEYRNQRNENISKENENDYEVDCYRHIHFKGLSTFQQS